MKSLDRLQDLQMIRGLLDSIMPAGIPGSLFILLEKTQRLQKQDHQEYWSDKLDHSNV